MTKYNVVAVCGSSVNEVDFISEEKRLTIKGNIVIPLGLYVHGSDTGILNEEGMRPMLAEMMRQKIAMADTVHVINTNGNIGNGTRCAIVFAVMSGKTITSMCELPKHRESIDNLLAELAATVIDEYGNLNIDSKEFYSKYGFHFSAIPMGSLRRGCNNLKRLRTT